MKRDRPNPPLVEFVTLTARQKPGAKPAPAGGGVIHEQRTHMTRGELIFCLRDVHRYWSTPRISYYEIEQLEQQNLIERNTTAICAIRLTEQGVLVKNSQPFK